MNEVLGYRLGHSSLQISLADDDDASGIYEDLECYEELSEAPEYMDMPDAKPNPVIIVHSWYV